MSLFYTLSLRVLQGVFSAFYAHEVYIPKGMVFPKGAIIAANHASFFDPPLVAASWPEPIHFLARKTLFDVPLLNPIITGLNAHPLKGTNDLSAFKQATALLAEGKKILIFPEGTRSPDGKIAPFKTGVAMLAERTKAPIIPCYIDGSFKVWPKQARFPKPFGYKTACIFGHPIYPEDFGTGKDAQAALTNHLHQEICKLPESKFYE
jgi:1-acyl-sn-glycerol-3-phosphate acyltransferase